jgi:hypothetical protein
MVTVSCAATGTCAGDDPSPATKVHVAVIRQHLHKVLVTADQAAVT